MEGIFGYTPGGYPLIAAGHSAVLMDVPTEDPRIPTVFAVLSRDGSVEAVLDAMAVGGMSNLPDFGIINVENGSTRILVRGTIRGRIGEQILTSNGLFADITTSADSVHLEGPTAGLAVQPFPLGTGIAQASSVQWTTQDGSSHQGQGVTDVAQMKSGGANPPSLGPLPTDNPAPNPGTVSQPNIEDSVSSLHAFEHLFTPQSVSGPSQAVGPDAAEVPGTPPQTRPSLGATQVAPPTSALKEILAEAAELGLDQGLVHPTDPTPPPTPVPSDESSSGFISSFDWKSPRHGIGGALQPESRDEVNRQPAAAEPRPPLVAMPSTVPDEAVSAVLPRPDRLPMEPLPTPPSGQAPYPPIATPSQDFNTEATVRKSHISALADGGPTVVAAQCVNGHFNPPYATSCRVCGADVPDQHPREIPRPALGVLHLSSGGTIMLDRGVVMGRNPHPVPGDLDQEPNLVKIADPGRDISSQHVQVRLDDWFVTVIDLSSTNGTQVILPHRPPVALRADEPMTIEPGTRVVLADAFDFVYEVA